MPDEKKHAMEVVQEEAPLRPAVQRASWVEALGGISLGGIVMGGLTLAMLAAATPGHGWGETRSAELVRQERLADIEAALAETGQPDESGTGPANHTAKE
jgi:hypothetical protein